MLGERFSLLYAPPLKLRNKGKCHYPPSISPFHYKMYKERIGMGLRERVLDIFQLDIEG